MIVAGEPSGDLHASRVASKLNDLAPGIHLVGMGGDLMEQSGVSLIFHIRDSAVMGIGEVVASIPAFLKKRKLLKRFIRETKPDALLLVDFAEFNVGLARFANQLSIPVIYYIPPKAWAWRPQRAKKIAKNTTIVASIFPFEATFYRGAGANAKFVGHPLVDFAQSNLSRAEARRALNLRENSPVLGLMPGSRRREVDRLLPVMLEAAHHIRQSLPDCQFILPLAPSIHPESLPNMPFVHLVKGNTYDSMRASDLMLIASGTATLEAACLGTPMIVVYKLSWLSWRVIKSLAAIDRSALPNIIAGREIVPELLQNDAQPSQITPIALKLLESSEARQSQQEELDNVYAQLGNPGAAERTAQIVLDCLHGGDGDTPLIKVGGLKTSFDRRKFER